MGAQAFETRRLTQAALSQPGKHIRDERRDVPARSDGSCRSHHSAVHRAGDEKPGGSKLPRAVHAPSPSMPATSLSILLMSNGTPSISDSLDSSRDDFVLIVAWLLAALRSSGPYPLLAISGEQGSAKTVLSKLLKALIGPNLALALARGTRADDCSQ
jgi:hypothetical protein